MAPLVNHKTANWWREKKLKSEEALSAGSCALQTGPPAARSQVNFTTDRVSSTAIRQRFIGDWASLGTAWIPR